jgi:hypothetical protein
MVKTAAPATASKHWRALEPIASAKNAGHMAFSGRPISSGRVRPLRLDLLTHLSTADAVEYK